MKKSVIDLFVPAQMEYQVRIATSLQGNWMEEV